MDKDIKKLEIFEKAYDFIIDNPVFVFGSDENNYFELNGNKMSIIKDKKIFRSMLLDVECVFNKLKQIPYKVFDLTEFDDLLNPLEADRRDEKRKKIWVNISTPIRIPHFIDTLLIYIYFFGNVPTMSEYAEFYEYLFIREISLEEKDPNRNNAYIVEHPNDRHSVGKTFVFDGKEYEDKLFRYKENFKTSNLPIYDFTRSHLYHRIYRNYGSIIRDIHHVLLFYKKGYNAIYNSFLDREGIDLVLEGVDVCAFSKTKAAEDFRKDKLENRHNNTFNKYIELIMLPDISSDKLSLLKEEVVPKIIDMVKEIQSTPNGEKKVLRLITTSKREELDIDLSWINNFDLSIK